MKNFTFLIFNNCVIQPLLFLFPLFSLVHPPPLVFCGFALLSTGLRGEKHLLLWFFWQSPKESHAEQRHRPLRGQFRSRKLALSPVSPRLAVEVEGGYREEGFGEKPTAERCFPGEARNIVHGFQRITNG